MAGRIPLLPSKYIQKLMANKDALKSFEELVSEERGYVELLIEKAKSTKHKAIEKLRHGGLLRKRLPFR